MARFAVRTLDWVDGQAAKRLTQHVYEQVLAGRRDILIALLHDDFALAGTRERLDRNSWIQLMTADTTWDRIDVEPVSDDRSLNNAVVVTARVVYAGSRADGPLSGTWNVVDVWQQAGVDWRLLSRTTFPAAA